MNSNAQAHSWLTQAGFAVRQHIMLKSIGTTLFISLFFSAYFYLLNNPAYPTTVMPSIGIDELISVQPLALPLYLSLWIYVSLPPALFTTRRELYGYAGAMAMTCLSGLIIFYFWPTAVPQANLDWSQYPELAFLKNVDAAGNACPSLHVITAVFSGLWLQHLLRRFGAPWWLLSCNGIWCLGIIYSTLATRQHVAVDVGAGLVLGLLAATLSFRYRIKHTPISQLRKLAL